MDLVPLPPKLLCWIGGGTSWSFVVDGDGGGGIGERVYFVAMTISERRVGDRVAIHSPIHSSDCPAW